MAGGDCIDAADVIAHRWDGLHACRVKAPSTLGTLPAQLPVGPHVRPAGPGEPPAAGPGLGRWGRTRRRADHRPRFTICETYGLAKEGARHHGYTGDERGYHPLLAIAAGTGDVLMSRLREGRATTPPAAPPTSCGQ